MTADEQHRIEFDRTARSLEAMGRKFITMWFGERCEVYQEGCECCERWKLLDALLANPFQDDQEGGTDA